MAPAPTIDHMKFHRLLWGKVDRNHTLYVDQTAIGAELGVNKWVMHRLMRAVIRDGRVKPVSKRATTMSGKVEVIDPDAWRVERGLAS